MLIKTWTEEDQKKQNEKLEEVISDVENKTKAQISSLVIFDLDGTLFDNRTRTMFILREISERFDYRLPQLVATMERFQDIAVVHYSLEKTLYLMGVTSPTEIEFIEKEWSQRFFSDEYQKFDIPMAGAKSYVTRIHNAGATVIYLTGRDVGGMLVGTTESLRLYGFPVGIMGTMMIVKKFFEEDDESFKSNVVPYLKRLGEVVAIFENEPANSNILYQAFPGANSFFVLSQHRPDAPELLKDINRIKDFRVRKYLLS